MHIVIDHKCFKKCSSQTQALFSRHLIATTVIKPQLLNHTVKMMSNIWVAAAENDFQTVLSHLDSGAFSPNSKDPNGYTPIHAATSYGHTELLKLLIERGGNVNIKDFEGDTPLHHVEDLATAKILVEEFMADYKLKNEEGQTAADFVEEQNEYPELTAYLKSLIHAQPELSATGTLPKAGEVEGHQIRYTIEDDHIPMVEESRKKLESIVKSENPEKALRELVTFAVRDGLADFKNSEEPDLKRSCEDKLSFNHTNEA